jgi:hypothetical protein
VGQPTLIIHLPHRFGLVPSVILLLIIVLATTSIAFAAEVTIPLNIDYLILDEALKESMYTSPGDRAELWNGSDQCQFLDATDPRFSYGSGGLEFETTAELSIGVEVSGNCMTPLEWSGIIEADLEPYIGSDLVIKFRVTDLNLYKPNHEKSLLVGHGFDLIKGNLIPRLETFSYDLKPALQQVDALVQAAAAPDVAGRVNRALSTLRPVSAVIPQPESLRVALASTLPAMPSAIESAPAAPLSQAEIEAWENVLDNWDAFLVFAIKQLGNTVTDQQVRDGLLDLLLDSRSRLVQALGQPQSKGGPDPVRVIFLDEWTRLREIVRSAAQRGMLGNRLLEFLSFISAGDALFAFDQAAPSLNLRISADDLRRLARLLAPQYAADPLAFSFDVDPELQKMFGVSEPLESRGPFEAPPDDASSAAPSPNPLTLPSTPLPPTGPSSSSSAFPSPDDMLRTPLGFVGPAEADAAEEDSLLEDLLNLGAVLNRVVVNDNNASRYKGSVQRLLTLTASREFSSDGAKVDLKDTYLDLVKSTGWQESCWRQFVIRRQGVRFLESGTGDIGLMQVNKYVWRGFYSLSRLEWDIIYNTSAGAAILMRLMHGAADHIPVSLADYSGTIARSTYSAYNGGPGAYDRWRKRDAPDRVREIDISFWAKYQVITSGQSFDILQCAAQWDSAPGH